MFYSAQTAGFYDQEIHGDNISSDAVEISAELHAALLEGQASGKRIVPDEVGRPTLADYPAPSAADIQRAKNTEARAYLASTDWYVIRQQETGEAVPADILAARKAAREAVVE